MEEKPWYVRYAFDWMLLLFAVPFITLRNMVPDDGWVAFSLEVILFWIFFMWLVTLPVEDHER